MQTMHGSHPPAQVFALPGKHTCTQQHAGNTWNLHTNIGPMIRSESGHTSLPGILTIEICEHLPRLPSAIMTGAPTPDVLANVAGTVLALIYP